MKLVTTEAVMTALCQHCDSHIEMCEECGMREIIESVPSAWISVNDRLPKEKDEYEVGAYVIATDGVVTTRAFYGYPGGHDEWFINAGEQWEETFDRPVTYWMPLPSAPEVEECGSD